MLMNVPRNDRADILIIRYRPALDCFVHYIIHIAKERRVTKSQCNWLEYIANLRRVVVVHRE